MKHTIHCNDCKNDKCFMKLCSPERLDLVSKSKNQNWYKKGDYIFKEGAPIFGIYFIQQGGVKVVTESINGRQQVVRLANDGKILGHRGLGIEKYYFSSVALKDTLICFVQNDVFRTICLNDTNLSYNMMVFYSLELARTGLLVKYQAQMNIREKVAQAFIYFYEVFGVDSNTKTLNVELSRQDIAETAGTTTEQITRQLRDFESEKLILRDKRQIQLLNIQGLEYIVRDYKIG